MLPSEAETKLKSTSEDVNIATHPGNDVYLGAGRINAYQAVIQPPTPPENIQATIAYAYDNNGNQIKQTIDENGVKKSPLLNMTLRIVSTRSFTPDATASEYRYDGGYRRIQSVDAQQPKNIFMTG